MNFLYPSFLFGLFAILIPIVIHLFNFQRYKTIKFTNVKFLKEIKEETRQRSEIKHLLVLLSRILFISFLVLAFAQPYIPLENKLESAEQKTISIYIDNSFSMDAVNEEGRLLDQAKLKAIEIAKAYKPTDLFQILTNDFESIHQKLVNREKYIKLVEEIELSPSVKSVSEIITRQSSVLNQNRNQKGISYLLSDYQITNSNFEDLQTDTNMIVRLIPLTPQRTNNLFIDSCWFEVPVRKSKVPDHLWVRLRSSGETDYKNTPLKLTINNQQKALASANINANQSTDVKLSYTLSSSGIKSCKISISDYPIAFDDNYFFSYEIPEKLNVIDISDSGNNKYTNLIFNKDEYFILSNQKTNQIDYSILQNNNLIILSNIREIPSGMGQELEKFVSNGGTLAIFPGSECNLNSYKKFFNSNLEINYYTQIDTQDNKINWLNLNHSLFKDVFNNVPERIDLPTTKMHYLLNKGIKSSKEVVLSLNDGNPFLAHYKRNKGNIYLFTVPLNSEKSNFPEHALFVPLIYNIAIHSQLTTPIYYTIGLDEIIEMPIKSIHDHTAIPHIKDKVLTNNSNEFDIIPEYKVNGQMSELIINGQIKKAGNYFITRNNINNSGISFNYNRAESKMTYHNSKQIENLITEYKLENIFVMDLQSKNTIKQLKELNEGKRLWKLCIIFALTFLSIEILLLRLWK